MPVPDSLDVAEVNISTPWHQSPKWSFVVYHVFALKYLVETDRITFMGFLKSFFSIASHVR